MAKRTSISPVGLSLIKAFEGFRPEATQLPNGLWVIGHGHTKTARNGAQVSRNDAEDLLLWDLSQLEPKIRDVIFAPISGPQMDSLLSLAFNIGIAAFRKSDVVRFLNQGDPISAAAAFDVWKKAKFNEHTIVVDALVRRRAAEKARFLKVDAGSLSLPTGRLQPLADGDLAAAIDADAVERAKPRDSDVVIDLDATAALSGLMGEQLVAEDGTMVTFGEGEPPQPEYHFSDTDEDESDTDVDDEAATSSQEDEAEVVETTEAESALTEVKPETEETGEEDENKSKPEKLAALVTPAVTAAMAEEGLVPIADALEQKDVSLKEVAENISGRLDKVAVPLDEKDELELPADDGETEPVEDEKPADIVETEEVQEAEPEDVPEILVEDEAEPPVEDPEWDEPVSEFTALDDEFAMVGDDLPPLPAENGEDDVDDSLSPEIISREMLSEQDREYDALSRRNLGMFILMGILGVIFTAGGIFELRRAGHVVTYWDMAKGPGMAALGLLLILAAVYYLVRRLGR